MAQKENGYSHGSLNWCVREYGMTLQTVRNYRAKGLPLTDPAALLLKILAMPGRKPPPAVLKRLQQLAQQQTGVVVGSPEPSRNDPKPPDKQSSGSTGSMSNVVHDLTSGLAAELKRLEDETAQSYANYLAELNPADKIIKQKIYLGNVNALRALAKDAPKADRDAKNVLPIGDIDSAWSRSIKEFRSSLEALPRRAATNPLFKKVDPVDTEEYLMKEVQAILGQLEAGSWLKGEDPAA